jgi:hypothetical protein
MTAVLTSIKELYKQFLPTVVFPNLFLSAKILQHQKNIVLTLNQDIQNTFVKRVQNNVGSFHTAHK